MKRREFMTLLGGATAAWPLAARAQQAPKIARIGYLVIGSLESPEARKSFDAFREGLYELGYIEGQNIVIEYRAADGKIDRLPALATELSRLKLDLIVAGATPAGLAAQQAFTTTPIVVAAMGDPVRDGLVASLARPGGNITGTTFLGPELVPKRLALLKEALPKIFRVAVLWHPGAFGERTMRDMLNEISDAAGTLGMQLQLVEVRQPNELDQAFSRMARERAEALFQFPSTMLFSERRRIVELAAIHRLPSMFNEREFVQLGGLISYGVSIADLGRRSVTYVDKILKGAKPSDLPVEQPTKFELVVNLKTAKALGVEIPATVLTRADEVIE
jgi:putative tryptophan/tyrosine transport system substrate-binding protein